MGVASFVLSILSWFSWLFWPIGLALGGLAVIFGGVSFRSVGHQKGFGIAGFIIGLVSVVVYVFFVGGLFLAERYGVV